MKNKTILIIEDDTILRENTAVFLKEKGYNVCVAEDGLKGVQIAIQQIPDLILCDITMPGMNGLELYKTIQQIKATATIPLIFITAKVEKEDIRAGMQLGADDYITKPFDLIELLQTIKIRLEKHERIQKTYDEKFYALIDNPLLGVFIYSENKFEYVNNVFTKLFGLDKNDFENMCFDDLVLNETNDQIIEKTGRTLKGIQESVHSVFAAFHKDPQRDLLVEIYANLINFKGVPALVGNAVDVTQRESKKIPFSTDDNTEDLSSREIEILKQVCQGLTTTEIAETNNISARTVDTHRYNLLCKTSSKNAAELVLYALRKKIIVID
jgi:PAS domain S-box-containing protein